MKRLLVAGVTGLLITQTASVCLGQGKTLRELMPSVAADHIVRYSYEYSKSGTGNLHYTGHVDLAVNPVTLYYREYRNKSPYRSVLYDRSTHHVLLFNHAQNRLNLFDSLPYDAVPFVPFPLQDEAIAQFVDLAPVEKRAVSGMAKTIQFSGALEPGVQSVPVQFHVTLSPGKSTRQVQQFAIRAPHGDVANWSFTYGNAAEGSVLPTTITRVISLPTMTEEGKKLLLAHEAVPPTNWRPDARVLYRFVWDHAAQPGEIPDDNALFQSANSQTIVVDRRDSKNPIRFTYRPDGGDLETQIRLAKLQGSPTKSTEAAIWSGANRNSLIAPGVVGVLCLAGVGWALMRRNTVPAKTQNPG